MEETQTFEIKEDHLKLLRGAYVSWESCEYGAPAINCKRPYGNSYVELDIVEILGWEHNPEDEFLPEGYEERARKLHEETKTVLQIILATGKFETGIYRQAEKYVSNSWEKIADTESAIKQLISALKEDEGYKESWKANIAMAFYDEFKDWSQNKVGRNKAPDHIKEIANNAADRFLDQLFLD